MNLKSFCIFFLFICVSVTSFAQSPYTLNWKKESIIYGTSGLLLGTGMGIHLSMNGLTEEEIFHLDPMNINAFDRPAIENYSLSARRISDVGLLSAYLAPTLFLTNKQMRKDFNVIAVLYSETILMTMGVTNITKRLAKRPRPFVLNPDVALDPKVKKEARFAFFSGHTSIAAAGSFFTAKVFSDYFPDSKWKPVVWGAAITIPAITGYMRVKAGKHFPTDVIAGYAVGAGIGWLIPHLHRKKVNKKATGLNLTSTGTGLAMSLRF